MKKFFCCLGLFFSGFVINTTLAYFISFKLDRPLLDFSLYNWNDPLLGDALNYLLSLATSISSTIILYLTVITCLVIYIVKKRISKAEFNSI